MPNTPLNSVTLKINRTSVMLYANEYVRLPDGRRASSQIYLASFPKTSADMPAAFEQKLREATAGRPERYFALYQRIENEVLIPTRVRLRQEAAARQRRELTSALQHVLRILNDIPNMPGYPTYTASAEFQQLLPALMTETAGLLALMPAASTPELPMETPEQSLQRLLDTVNSACTKIATLMPEAAKEFKRGYRFEDETLQRVRQFWFRSADAVAALSARTQFRRPANWTALRSQVLTDTAEKSE